MSVNNPGSAETRLHIGGEQVRAGWKIINPQPGPGVDYVADATILARFAENSVAEIYASHVLEHVGYQSELPAILAQMRRVLRPGGRLMVSVPDLIAIFKIFIEPTRSYEDRYVLMRAIFGGQLNAWDYHKAGFDRVLLARALGDAGFVGAKRVRSFGLFNDTSEVVAFGQPMSLNMEAFKPA